MVQRQLIVLLFAIAIAGLACSRSNNLLFGQVEATVGGHVVEVTDCYRTSVPPPQQLPNLPNGKPVFQFVPCKDADVLIRGDELIVNGESYGMLKQGDLVTVDHGRVLVNKHAAHLNLDR